MGISVISKIYKPIIDKLNMDNATRRFGKNSDGTEKLFWVNKQLRIMRRYFHLKVVKIEPMDDSFLKIELEDNRESLWPFKISSRNFTLQVGDIVTVDLGKNKRSKRKWLEKHVGQEISLIKIPFGNTQMRSGIPFITFYTHDDQYSRPPAPHMDQPDKQGNKIWDVDWAQVISYFTPEFIEALDGAKTKEEREQIIREALLSVVDKTPVDEYLREREERKIVQRSPFLIWQTSRNFRSYWSNFEMIPKEVKQEWANNEEKMMLSVFREPLKVKETIEIIRRVVYANQTDGLAKFEDVIRLFYLTQAIGYNIYKTVNLYTPVRYVNFTGGGFSFYGKWTIKAMKKLSHDYYVDPKGNHKERAQRIISSVRPENPKMFICRPAYPFSYFEKSIKILPSDWYYAHLFSNPSFSALSFQRGGAALDVETNFRKCTFCGSYCHITEKTCHKCNNEVNSPRNAVPFGNWIDDTFRDLTPRSTKMRGWVKYEYLKQKGLTETKMLKLGGFGKKGGTKSTAAAREKADEIIDKRLQKGNVYYDIFRKKFDRAMLPVPYIVEKIYGK